jgi:DnaJ-class molecular chaperone
MTECPECRGTGEYHFNDDGAVYHGTCGKCNGTGKIEKKNL